MGHVDGSGFVGWTMLAGRRFGLYIMLKDGRLQVDNCIEAIWVLNQTLLLVTRMSIRTNSLPVCALSPRDSMY
jgi:hypothetical protein